MTAFYQMHMNTPLTRALKTRVVSAYPSLLSLHLQRSSSVVSLYLSCLSHVSRLSRIFHVSVSNPPRSILPSSPPRRSLKL